MKNLLTNWKAGTDFGILALRIAMGFSLFYGHGLGKLGRIFPIADIQFMDPIGIGATTSFILVALTEGILALMVMLGLFTRFAAIPIIIMMAIIVFIVHGGDAFGDLEMPFIYLLGFLAIFLTGGGKHSIDRLFIR